MEYSIIDKCLTESKKWDVSQAEIRVFSVNDENLTVKNGQIERASQRFHRGINLSVIGKEGARGFATSARIVEDDIPELVKHAVGVAKASASKMRKKVDLTEEPIIKDEYKTKYQRDPFEVEFEEKLEVLKNADQVLRENSQIKVATSNMETRRVNLHFANTEGTQLYQQQTFMGAGVEATAVGQQIQTREHHDYQMRGFEFIDEFHYEDEARRVANEALVLVNEAKNAPNEKSTFVLCPYMLGLTIHESTGHPTELDRAMGFEADFAGTSFLTPDLLGKDYRYGSDLVNLVCDPTIPGNLGHYKYDDEGVATKRFNIIENGIFKNYMTDRETAKEVGYEHSFGNSRISQYNRIPIVRMSHLYLEPDPNGPNGFEDFIGEIKNGIYASGWKSHSIDDKRVNFQFSTQIAWKIENGELTTPLKNLCYNAKTPEFWGSLDMISRDNNIYGHGPICGKGVPMQGMWISHGGGHARFNDVNIFAG
ncbi:MAG: TldD/PmbA family protein [Candidatus Kariarchaeaceae archaeon]|jgi:TldD protein